MHLLLTDIQWDTEGQTREECRLPENVIVLDCPELPVFSDSERIGIHLLDTFGFDHDGFNAEKLSEVHDTHAGGAFFPTNLAVIRYPVLIG
jgi:hypothetical protein